MPNKKFLFSIGVVIILFFVLILVCSNENIRNKWTPFGEEIKTEQNLFPLGNTNQATHESNGNSSKQNMQDIALNETDIQRD